MPTNRDVVADMRAWGALWSPPRTPTAKGAAVEPRERLLGPALPLPLGNQPAAGPAAPLDSSGTTSPLLAGSSLPRPALSWPSPSHLTFRGDKQMASSTAPSNAAGRADSSSSCPTRSALSPPHPAFRGDRRVASSSAPLTATGNKQMASLPAPSTAAGDGHCCPTATMICMWLGQIGEMPHGPCLVDGRQWSQLDTRPRIFPG